MRYITTIILIALLHIGGCGGSQPERTPPVVITPPPVIIPDVIPDPDICDNIFIPEDVSFEYDDSVQDIAFMDDLRPFTINESIWAEEVYSCFVGKRVMSPEERACINQKDIFVAVVDGDCPHQVLPNQQAVTCTSSLTIIPAPKNKCVNTGCARKDHLGNGVLVMERGRLQTNYEGLFKHELTHILAYMLDQRAGHYEPWFVLDDVIQLEEGTKNDWDSVCSRNNQGFLTKDEWTEQVIDIYLEDG